MDLTTATFTRAFIESDGRKITGSTFTTIVGRLIAMYSAEAETYMGRTVEISTYTEALDVAPGQAVFSLKAYPVTSVSSVINDPGRTFDAGTLDSTTYSLDTNNGVMRIDRAFVACGFGALQVIYTGGMAASAASFASSYPAISDAIAMQVAYHYQRRSSLGRTGVSDGRGSVSYTGPIDWLPHVVSVLDRHRRYSFGG